MVPQPGPALDHRRLDTGPVPSRCFVMSNLHTWADPELGEAESPPFIQTDRYGGVGPATTPP